MNNNDKKEVVPLIINGEINDGRNKKKKNNFSNERLPKKRFTFADVLLTIVGIALVVYGVNTLLNPKEKEKNEEKSNTSEIKKDEVKAEDLKKYIPTELSDFYNIYSKEDINNMKNELSIKNLSNNAIISLASRLAPTYGSDNDRYYLEEDIDSSVNKLFGNISYAKTKFNYGNYEYTYNQETKRYYLLNSSSKYNQNLHKYDYIDLEDKKDYVLIKDYIVYSINNISTLVDGTKLNLAIDNSNIKDNLSNIKYIEYKFEKQDNDYKLVTISIK